MTFLKLSVIAEMNIGIRNLMFVNYLIFYFSKIITKEEFNELIPIIPILHSQSKFIQIIVRTIVKFLPSERKDQ